MPGLMRFHHLTHQHDPRHQMFCFLEPCPGTGILVATRARIISFGEAVQRQSGTPFSRIHPAGAS
jgi:hypothetical protein